MNRCEKLYFHWLTSMTCGDSEIQEYSLLLMELFDIPFVSKMDMDNNMVENSKNLRENFLYENFAGAKLYNIYGGMDFECNILELLTYISLEIENTIMSNNQFGDRTSTWFWLMLDNLGLKKYDNLHFDQGKVDEILEKFVNKEYKKSGKGGLFYLNDHNFDARDLDIWRQAMIFLAKFAVKNGEIW